MDSKRFFGMILLLFIFLQAASGETEDAAPAGWENTGYLDTAPETAHCLGFTLDQVFEEYGFPAEIFPFRGEEEWQDNVIFYYPDHLYLFWFQNRVWQVRMDERFESYFLNIRMGMRREAVIRRLGKPFYSDAQSIVYNLPDRGVPVRMRLFFSDGESADADALSDAYIYRGDF